MKYSQIDVETQIGVIFVVAELVVVAAVVGQTRRVNLPFTDLSASVR